MTFKMKRRLLHLMDSISDMLKILTTLSDPVSAVLDCLAALDAIQFQLQQEEVLPQNTAIQLRALQLSLNELLNGNSVLNENITLELEGQINLIKDSFDEEVLGKLNVVFFPYKAAMWDSLETIYEAAASDENCIAHVVPIPYYQLSQDEAIATYEGERFPKNVPITHFNDYHLEIEQPDIIFVHNIYDQYNTITRVHEHYFTTNLKQYTDMLVYVPYHVSSFITPNEGGSLSYSVPTVKNVDKIILVGEFLKQAALRDGIPEEKLLPLGSPKLDAMVNVLNREVEYPEEWRDKIKGKTVYLLNTGCLYFAEQQFIRLEWLIDFLNIPRIDENSVIIWRPHPLTKISIMKYTPYLAEYYMDLTEKYIKGGDKLYEGVILDETDDYLPALKAADVLISPDGSLLRSYLLTEKKVILWDEDMPERSLLPKDVFYYAFNQSEPWYKLVKKFSNGYDPLIENRKGIVSNIYANADGTSGEKVYQAIKNCVLIENLQ